MDALKEFTRLRDEEQRARARADKAEGALDEVMKVIKKEFDCASLDKAKDKLKLLEKEEAKVRKEFEKAVTAYDEKWNSEKSDE